jgi:hypothetical protein
MLPRSLRYAHRLQVLLDELADPEQRVQDIEENLDDACMERAIHHLREAIVSLEFAVWHELSEE